MKYWTIAKQAVSGFIEDGALSRGAAIAYYTIFSLAPILVIVIALVGLIFGQEAAEGAIVVQLRGLMGEQSAQAVQSMISSASSRQSGILATIIGIGALLVGATGVFGEIQSSLNAIWKAEPKTSAVTQLVKVRIASFGLILTLGFLLVVSLAVTAALSALDAYLSGIFPGIHLVFQGLNFLASLGLISVLFGAIYKFLPDIQIAWRDVLMGAVITALLFTVGKTLIGLYIGSSKVASSYGAAGALIVILLWIYYSAQIFLLGSEFTKAYANSHGSHAKQPARGGHRASSPGAA